MRIARPTRTVAQTGARFLSLRCSPDFWLPLQLAKSFLFHAFTAKIGFERTNLVFYPRSEPLPNPVQSSSLRCFPETWLRFNPSNLLPSQSVAARIGFVLQFSVPARSSPPPMIPKSRAVTAGFVFAISFWTHSYCAKVESR